MTPAPSVATPTERTAVWTPQEQNTVNNPKFPTFLTKGAELNAKHPENSMPYFPTEEL
ncbi:hypothetical protein OG21DRAFT_1491873 [Imleria badia]|nr:hypothetical protein OG21DRAFT_1491873 [Imleria badia]